MVVIRLSRGGAKKRPFYNIVATDRRNRRDGRFLERIGYYNPMASGQDQSIQLAMDRIEFWTKQGAQVSDAVARLIKVNAGDKPEKPSKKKTRAIKKAEAAKAEAAGASEDAADGAEEATADAAAEGADDAKDKAD